MLCSILISLSENKVELWTEDVDKRIHHGLKIGRARGFIKKDDPIIIVTGWRAGSGYTNTMRIINAPDNDNMPIMGVPIIKDYND